MIYEQHPISAFYPPLTEEAKTKLRALVRTQHQTMPPGILFEGKVLDGWHYYRICLEEHIKPEFETPEIADPLEFVVRRNEGRRHLTTGQRAVVAERMANWKHGTNQYQKKVDFRIRNSTSGKKALKEAASLNKVGLTSVTEVRHAKENGIPEIYKALEDGKLKPYRADEIAALPKDQQAEALKAELNGDKSAGNRKRRDASPNKQNRPTRYELMERSQQMLRKGLKAGGETLGLSREQVDPDFKGSGMDWVDTYGHVQIMNKNELAAHKRHVALMDWVKALNDLRKPLEEYLKTKCDPADLETMYVSKSRERRTQKLREMVDMIIKARESVEWLEKILEQK
jgi:hypothetical protein